MIAIANKVVEQMQGISPAVKGWIDLTALGSIILGWMNFFQAGFTMLSTIAGFVWIAIRIWETETLKKWNKARKARKAG